MLETLYSDMNGEAVGCEFSRKSIIQYLWGGEGEICPSVPDAAPERVPVTAIV